MCAQVNPTSSLRALVIAFDPARTLGTRVRVFRCRLTAFAREVPLLMRRTLDSCRLYFWPLIAANTAAATYGAGGDPWTSLDLSLVLCLLASFGFLANDLADRRIDLVNRAGHFEHANGGTLLIAAGTALLMVVTAMVLAWDAGPMDLITAASIASILLSYSYVLRRLPLVPNLATGVVASSPLWAPLMLSASGGRPWQWWQVGAIVLLLTAREILMDVRDQLGDIAGGRRTLPIVFGARRCASAAAWLTLAGVVLLVLAIAIGLRQVQVAAQMGALILAAALAFTLLRETTSIATAEGDRRDAIQRYVYRTRLAMACLPAFAVLLT